MFPSRSRWSVLLIVSLFAQHSGIAVYAQAPVDRAPQSQQTIPDVALDTNGVLKGQAVDGNGKPLEGTKVSIFQGKELLYSSITDKNGAFQVSSLKSGVYRFELPTAMAMCRVWEPQIAPPGAKTSVLMVSGTPVSRGQMGMFDPVNTAALLLGVATVTLTAITLNEVDDLQGQVNRLKSN